MDNKIFFVAIEIYYQKLNFIAIKNFVPIKLFSFLVVRQKKKEKKKGKDIDVAESWVFVFP